MSRILIIEDETPMRTALADLLASEGHRALTAADGESGLKRALEEKPDLVLLDVMMPRLDGFALCAELRRLSNAVPVLMLTAKGQIEDRVTALLQQGLFEEQANRNLDAAISDYQTLARQFDQDRQLAATAVFRLGECYWMQGKTNEAALEYQRILRDFSDQTTLATLSRQDLAGMGMVPTSAVPSENSDAKILAILKHLSLEQAESVMPTLVPDSALTELLQQRGEMETKMAESRVQYSTNNPAYQQQEAALNTINHQIYERINGIMEALTLRAGLSQTTPAASAPADDENQEITRIQTMIQNSPDLINAPDSSSGNTPLAKAAYNGWLKVAAFLLDHGANVNARGGVALMDATGAGNRAMVEFLLAHGADVNANWQNGDTPLALAARKGFQAVTEALLASHADVNAQNHSGTASLALTPLVSAVQGGHLKIVQMLLAAGAKVNLKDSKGETVLNYALGISPEIFQALLNAGADPNTEDATGRTPLSYAAERDSSDVVKMLLAAKADPNGGKLDAPLLCAIHKQDAASAEMLLQAGANPNVKGRVSWNVYFNNTMQINGSEAETPLWLAVDTKQFPTVQLLLKFKADPNDSQTDARPLLFSALSDTNILEALLVAGAKVDATSADGPRWTPLAAAANQNNAPAVQVLLKHGANPNARDKDGETPLHCAEFNLADGEIFELLLQNKADPNVRDNFGATPLDLLKARLANGVPPEQKDLVGQLSDLLRQHGALDVLPDWDRITVSRPSAHYSKTIFYKGTNDWNQFTLFDLLGVQYELLTASPRGAQRVRVAPYGLDGSAVENSLTFPDFSRIIIHRPSASGTNWTEVKINLARAFDSGDCAGDVPLKFGDVVEIPEVDHVINEPWQGLFTNELFTLKNCLTRHLQITVNGQTTDIILAPQITMQPNVVFRVEQGPITMVRILKFEPFKLWPVLDNSKLLLASSDLSRVTVKRRNAATGKTREWTVDCSNPNSPPDFWLRDGDVIEVPEKP